MIKVTRLNALELVVNASHIVTIEATPDTLVTLFSGEKLMVRETPEEIIERVVCYLRRLGLTGQMPSVGQG